MPKIFYDIIPPKVIEGMKYEKKLAEIKKLDKPRPRFVIWRNFILKITVILLIVGLNWTGLSVVIETLGFLNDTEDSAQNIFAASTLDFSLDSPPDFSPIIIPNATSSRDISVLNDGILDFDYKVEATNTVGVLCDHLDLEAKLNGTSTFNGALTDFDYNVGGFATTTRDWQFIATLTSNDPSLQNQTCVFDFVFDGVQIGGAGFYDQEIIPNTVRSGKWIIKQGDVVINELMWMGSYRNADDEWLELRNMTDSDINISSWQLTKLVGFGTNKHEELMLEIPDGRTIPANGFFLISKLDKSNSAMNVEPDLVDSEVALRDLNLQIKLYKGDWDDSDNLIDTAGDGQGINFDGWHGLFFHLSMERNDVPEDGTLDSNWHTCLEFFGTRIYWDAKDIFNLGTPTAPNLSDEEDSGLEYYIQKEKELLAEGIYPPDPISDELFDEKPPAEVKEIPVEADVADETADDEAVEEAAEDGDETAKDNEGNTPDDDKAVDDKAVNEAADEFADEAVDETIDETEDETPADETPAVDEQPAVVPDGAGESVSDGGNGDGGNDASDSSDGSSPAEGAGGSSGDSSIDAGSDSASEY